MDHVEILWEIDQIEKLKARYFRYLDSKHWDLYRSVFTDDARVWVGVEGQDNSPTATYEAIDDFVYGFMKDFHDADQVVSVHQGHMPEIEILTPTTARAVWAMFDWVDRPAKFAFQGFGHYYEEYEKGDDGQWRIKILKLTRLRRDDLPSHLEAAPHYGHWPKDWPQ
jgi:hypothetical protein